MVIKNFDSKTADAVLVFSGGLVAVTRMNPLPYVGVVSFSLAECLIRIIGCGPAR